MSPITTHRSLVHLATATIFIAAGGFGLKNCGRSHEAASSQNATGESSAVSTDVGRTTAGAVDRRMPGSPRTAPDLDPLHEVVVAQLAELISQLKTSGDPELAGAVRALLRDSVTEASITAILAYLDSGEDVAIEADFVVGAGKFLDSAPTLRVLLLDLLGELDARTAADYSQKIFREPTSADEWAIALRNHAAGHQLHTSASAMADATLTARVVEALTHESWQQAPSVGFLHLLDFAVLAPGAASVAALADLAAPLSTTPHPAVRRVANNQLWRLAHRDFTETVGHLEQAEALGRLDPTSRAVLIAHADLREDGERRVIERYLSADLPEAELDQFAAVFPYYGLEVTSHLATQNERQNMADDADAVIEAYQTVRQWRRDGTFPGKEDALGRIETRLERLAVSIARGLEQK